MEPAVSSRVRMPDLLTQTELAQVFGVSPRTIRRWTRNGELHPVRVGGITRYRADDVNALIASSTRVPGVIGLVHEARATSLYAMHMEVLQRLADVLGCKPEDLLPDDHQEETDDR